MCFQYKITVAINHDSIVEHPEKISKMIPYIEP